MVSFRDPLICDLLLHNSILVGDTGHTRDVLFLQDGQRTRSDWTTVHCLLLSALGAAGQTGKQDQDQPVKNE